MALKITEQALRKRRIQADFAEWAKRLKPHHPEIGLPQPPGVVQRVAAPTRTAEQVTPVTSERAPTKEVAQLRPEISLPEPQLMEEGPEEPEDAPRGAVPLSEVEPRQLAQDLAAVQEEPTKGALEYWAPVADLVTRERVAQEHMPAAIAVVLSIMQARSGGRPDHVLGDSVGLFGMSAREKQRVEYDLIRRKELDPDVGMSSEDFFEWRLDPKNQLAYYTPLIVHYVQMGLQQGLPLADLAVFVGDRIQVPGATVQADYKQALSIVWSQAQEWVQETSRGQLPDALRETPYADGRVDGKETGLPPYVRGAPGQYDTPLEDIAPLGTSVTLPGGKGAFPTRPARPWAGTEVFWNTIKHLYMVPKQWVGVHRNHAESTGDRRKQLAMKEAGYIVDRVLSVPGAIITGLWAIGGRGVGGSLPFVLKVVKDVVNRDRYHWAKVDGTPIGLTGRVGQHLKEWQRGVERSIERAAEIYKPDYPGASSESFVPEKPFATWKAGEVLALDAAEEKGPGFWTNISIKRFKEREELIEALREADREEFKEIKREQFRSSEGFSSARGQDSIFELQNIMRGGGDLLSGDNALVELVKNLFREDLLIYDEAADDIGTLEQLKTRRVRGTKAFKTFGIRGSSNWTSEKIDEEWDKGKDFQYTWMFDAQAEDEYLAARDAVEEQINWLRAQKIDPNTGQPYPPRRLDYYEIEELQKRYANPYTEMAGEAVLDFGWLLDKPMSWMFRTFLKPAAVAGWRPMHKFLVNKMPWYGSYLSHTVRSSGTRVGKVSIETLDDWANALNPEVWRHLGKDFQNVDGSPLSVEDLLKSQQRHSGEEYLTKAELANRLAHQTGQIYNPRTGEVILKSDAAVTPGKKAIRATLATRMHEIGMGGGVAVQGKRWVDTGMWGGKDHRRTGTKAAEEGIGVGKWKFGQERIANRWKKTVAQSMPARFAHLADIFKYSPMRAPDMSVKDYWWELLNETAKEVGEKYNIQERAAGAWEKLSIAERERMIYEAFSNRHVVPEFLRRHGIAQGDKPFYYSHIDGTQIFVAERHKFFGEAPEYLRRLWIESNLSARPGFTIRNVLDSYFRMHIAGGWGSHRKTIAQLIEDTYYPEQMMGSFATHELGAHVQTFLHRKRLPRAWSGRDWLEAMADVSEKAAQDAAEKTSARSAMARLPIPWIGRKGGGPLQHFRPKLKDIDTGEIKERYINFSLSTFMEMARDWNEAFEIMARMRLYDNFFHHTYDELRRHYARHFFTRLREEPSSGLRKTLDIVLEKKFKNAQDVIPWLTNILTEEGLMVDVIVPSDTILRFLEPPESLRNTQFYSEGWGQDIAQDLSKGLYDTWLNNGYLDEELVRKLFDEVEDRIKRKLHTAYLEEVHRKVVNQGDDNVVQAQDNMFKDEPPPLQSNEQVELTRTDPDPETDVITVEQEFRDSEDMRSPRETIEVIGKQSASKLSSETTNKHIDKMQDIRGWIDKLFAEGEGPTLTPEGYKLRNRLSLRNWGNTLFRGWLDNFPSPVYDKPDGTFWMWARHSGYAESADVAKAWAQRQRIMVMVEGRLTEKYENIDSELRNILTGGYGAPVETLGNMQEKLKSEIEKLSKTEEYFNVVLGPQGEYWDTLGNMKTEKGIPYNKVVAEHKVSVEFPDAKNRDELVEEYAEEYKNRLGYIHIQAFFDENGQLLSRGAVERLPVQGDLNMRIAVDPSKIGKDIHKLSPDDTIQSFVSLGALTSGVLERKTGELGKRPLTGNYGWRVQNKSGQKVGKNGLFRLFDDETYQLLDDASQESGSSGLMIVHDDLGETSLEEYLEGNALIDENIFHNKAIEVPEVVPEANQASTGHVNRTPPGDEIRASVSGDNPGSASPEKDVFLKPHDELTDGELEFRIAHVYELHGELANGRLVVVDENIRRELKLDEKELHRRYASRAIRQGWDGITEHEQTMLQLHELMADFGDIAADTEALVVGKGSGAADLAVFNENLVQRVTWDEYRNDIASHLTPVELLGYEEKVSKIVRQHLTGELELKADVMVPLDKAGKAKSTAYDWKSLRALALLHGVVDSSYKKGLAGHKRALAEHIEAVAALDVLMKAEGADRLKKWVTGNLEGLEDMRPFREVYEKLFPGRESVLPEGVGGSAVVAAELENDITVIQTLIWAYRDKMRNQIVDRKLINYLDYAYKAVLNPEVRETLTTEVLMSYLHAERVAVARQGAGGAKGFSKFLTPIEQRSFTMQELFDKLDFHPQNLLSPERITKEKWQIVVSKETGDEYHYDTIEDAWRTISEMAAGPRMEGDIDAGFRFGIKHSKAYGADIFTLYERKVDVGTKSPELLNWDDFLIWLRANLNPDNRDKYGWKKWSEGDGIKFFAELAAIGGLVDSRSTAGMSPARLDAWKFAQDAREAVIKKALDSGVNVPVAYINQIEGMASWHLARNNLARANLVETIIPGPQGGALRFGEALKGVAKGPEGAKFVTLDEWEPIADAFYKQDFGVEVEKLGSAFEQVPSLRRVSAKQREKGRQVQYPDGIEAVLALNADVINAESDLHLLRRVRTQINKYRGTGTSRFKEYASTIRERALGTVKKEDKAELMAMALHWEDADDRFGLILTALDDKIYALDPHWHDNGLRLREAFKQSLRDKGSALRREIDKIFDSQEGRKVDPTRADEEVRRRTNKERPSYQEVANVLAALKRRADVEGWTAQDLRTWALAETLAGAASRISRISNLAWKDIDIKEGQIWLRHKDFKGPRRFKGSERTGGAIYHLDPEAKEALDRWQQYVLSKWGASKITDETPVFTWIKGQEKYAKEKPTAMTPQTLRNHLTGKNSVAVELFKDTDRTLQPHDFRRYFASKKFKHTFGDVTLTAEFMNHKSPTTTVTYLLAMGHTIEQLSDVVSKSEKAIRAFASLPKVERELRKAVDAKQFLDAQSVRVYMPHIMKASAPQVDQMKVNWKKHLETEKSDDIKNLFKKGEVFGPRTSLKKQFFAEAARRSRQGTEDVNVIIRLLEALRKRRAEALKDSSFGDMNFTEDVVKPFLNELKGLSPKRIVTQQPIIPEVAGPRRFKGFRLVNEKGEWIKGGSLFRDEATASKAADILRKLTQVDRISYKEVPDYIEMSWRQMLGDAYGNWRRDKWLNYQDQIMAHPDYAYIVAEGIEARNILLGPRGHTIGLEEFDPFKEGPLSYDRFMVELEANLAVPLDTAQVLPRNMVPNDSIQGSGKNSGAWIKQIRENKEINPISLPTVTIDEKEVPILMITPNRGYHLVPLKEYKNKARAWKSGHVSGFEGVKVKWKVPVAQGGKGGQGKAETFVMTRDTHFFRPDEFVERITGEKWGSDVLVSGFEGTFENGSELTRYVVAVVDADDLKTNRVVKEGRMVESEEFPSLFKGEQPVDPTGEIPHDALKMQARHLDANLLLETTDFYGHGMPLVTADGVVIDGSGRVNMLKMARDAVGDEAEPLLSSRWLAYQEAVKENLLRFNFSGEARERLRDITSLKNPVMVRILKDQLSDYHVARIVRQANDPRMVGSPDVLKKIVAADIEKLDLEMMTVRGGVAPEGIDDLHDLMRVRVLPDGREMLVDSGGPPRDLRDRYARAMLVKLFGRAENESKVYGLANFMARNNDKHTQTLLDGILKNYKVLNDLLGVSRGEEQLDVLFKNIEGTIVLIERARTQFPTVDFAVIVETLAAGESKTFSAFLQENPVVLELARLLARDVQAPLPGQAVVGVFAEFAEEVRRATPDQPKAVQVTLAGETPEEILRNAIKNNTPESEFDRAAEEGVGRLKERVERLNYTGTESGLPKDTPASDVVEEPGPGGLGAIEETRERARVEANKMRYMAGDIGIYLDFVPADIEAYNDLRNIVIAATKDKRRATEKLRNLSNRTIMKLMDPPDLVLADKIDELDQLILATVVNLESNRDLYRTLDIGGTNRGEWQSLKDLAEWTPIPGAKDEFQTGMQIFEESLKRYNKGLLAKEWTVAEVTAYDRIMKRVRGNVPRTAVPDLLAIVKGGPTPSYEAMRTFWKIVDDVLLNKGGMPGEGLMYSTWEMGPPGHFVYTPEGIALRNKVVAHIHEGSDNPGHLAKAVDTVVATESELQQTLDQMHILARLFYAPAETRAAGGGKREGGLALGNYGEVLGSEKVSGKSVRAPFDAHNLMLEMLRKKRKGVGIGKNLSAEQEGFIMENLRGGMHFQAGGKPEGLNERVWNNLNEFHIASEIDEFFSQGATKVPSKFNKDTLVHKYTFTTVEEMVAELNRWIKRGHEEMKHFYHTLSPEFRIARETPMVYTMDSKIPTRLLERLALIRSEANVGAKAAKDTHTYYSGKKKLENWLGPVEGKGGGGEGIPKDIDPDKMLEFEEMMKWLDSIFKEWRTTLLGNGGILGNKIQLTSAERDQLFSIVRNEIIPDTVRLQRAASIGSEDALVFENTVTAGPATTPWEELADRRFDTAMSEWAKTREFPLGHGKHDMDLLERLVLEGDEDIVGFGVTAEIEAASVADNLKSEYVSVFGKEEVAEANIKAEFLARLENKVEAVKNKPATFNWQTEELKVTTRDGEPGKPWRRGGRVVEGQPREAAAEVAFLEQRPDTEEIYEIAPGYFQRARDASPVYMELGIHNPFEQQSLGRPIVGAVQRVGTAMVDYSNQSTLDAMAKVVFPFWVFPTRSLKFWGEQLLTKPEILAASAKIGDMSERMSYDAGLVSTSGHQLPRFSGYINLGGGQWWVNPRSLLSYVQVVPHYRDVYVEDIDPDATAAQQVSHFLNSTARYTGLYTAPWIGQPLRAWTGDEEGYLKPSLFGQTSLVPPWMYRNIAEYASGILGKPVSVENIGVLGSPEVPWKDFLIQRDMLFRVIEEMKTLDDFEKNQLVEELKVEIAMREGPRWEAARSDLEYDEMYARILGYFSGIHQKQVRQGEVELYKIRDEIGALRKQIAFDANNEAFYRQWRYNTAEGGLYGLYQTIANVREGGEPDGRTLWGDERAMAIAKAIEEDRNFGAYLAADAGLSRMATLALAEQPVGSPREVRDPIYQERLEGAKILKEKFPDVGKYVWSPYNKNPETIRKHVTDKWMNMLKDLGLRPEWNSEDGVLWDDYQTQILAWEAQLPEIADVLIEELFAQLAEEELNVDVPDEETGETTNMFLELYGGTREAAKIKLLAMATGDQWNYWDIENDGLYDALNRVYRDNYYGAYWDFVGDSSKSERRAKEKQWADMYPGGPTEMQILEWMDQVPAYQGKWTDGEILLHMTGRDPLAVEERIELRNTPRENQADEIFKWDGWAGPSGSEFLNAVSTIGGEDMKDALLDMFKSERKQLGDRGHWVHWNEEFFGRVYNAAHMAAQELGLTEPTDAQNAEWMQVEALDVQFAEYREKLYGPDWEGLEDRYFAMSNEGRVEWRAANPEAWADLQSGWDLKTPFGD